LQTGTPPQPIPAPAKPLIDTCILCARHSCRLLSESWIHGAFPALYHDLTQYLFSVLTVLALSSLLGHDDSAADREWFEELVQLLYQLRDSGNFPAREFCRHADLMVAAVDKAAGRTNASGMGGGDLSMGLGSAQTGNGEERDPGGFGAGAAAVTAETALAEPSLQELLMQPTSEMQFPDSGFDLFNDGNGLYWPDFDFSV